MSVLGAFVGLSASSGDTTLRVHSCAGGALHFVIISAEYDSKRWASENKRA